MQHKRPDPEKYDDFQKSLMKYEERDQPLVYESDNPIYDSFSWYDCDCDDEKEKK